MNIKDFLIDNYIWIIVVILLSIVTVIGFLADKKKNGKKSDSTGNANPQTPNNVEPNTVETPIAQVVNGPQVLGMPTPIGQPLNTTVTPLNSVPGEPVMAPPTNETMMPNQFNNNQMGIVPNIPSVGPTEVVNTVTQMAPAPEPVVPTPVATPVEVAMPQLVNPMPINNPVMPGAPEPVQYTTPQPVAPMPIPTPAPQPVNPIPAPTGIPQGTPMNTMQAPVMPQPAEPVQPAPTSGQPTGFVFGPNNNQNM